MSNQRTNVLPRAIAVPTMIFLIIVPTFFFTVVGGLLFPPLAVVIPVWVIWMVRRKVARERAQAAGSWAPPTGKPW